MSQLWIYKTKVGFDFERPNESQNTHRNNEHHEAHSRFEIEAKHKTNKHK